MGGGGIIFNILYYIKNQYSEDKFWGLLLIVIGAVFTLIFCIYFVLPIVELVFINKMHEREINSKDGKKKYISNHLGKIIEFKINKNLNKKDITNEKIDKIIDNLNNIEEE